MWLSCFALLCFVVFLRMRVLMVLLLRRLILLCTVDCRCYYGCFFFFFFFFPSWVRLGVFFFALRIWGQAAWDVIASLFLYAEKCKWERRRAGGVNCVAVVFLFCGFFFLWCFFFFFRVSFRRFYFSVVAFFFLFCGGFYFSVLALFSVWLRPFFFL
jgi:hypothetical protein